MNALFLLLLINFLRFSLSQIELPSDCGEVKIGHGLSIGGEFSVKGEWPWFAPLFDKRHNDRFFCGSTIITNVHLLSAAHCFIEKPAGDRKNASDVFAQFGRNDLDDDNESDVVKIDLSQIFVHPDFNSSAKVVSFDGDIAIARLKSKIEFNSLIQPICLPEKNADVFNLQGTIVGYGLDETDRITRKQKHVTIKSIKHGVCLYTVPKLATMGSLRMFCAGERGKLPCRGDSGGGFYVEKNGRFQTMGIVSTSANKNCSANEFVLFTNVAKYIEWIDGNFESLLAGNLRKKDSISSCGVRKINKEVASSETYHGQWPWVATLHVKFQFKDEYMFFCSATLVNKWTLITVNHPSQNRNIFAILGRYNISNTHEQHWIQRRFSQKIVHEDFDIFRQLSKSDADLALLIMKEPVSFTDYIQPICLTSGGNLKLLQGYSESYGQPNSESPPVEIPVTKTGTFVNLTTCYSSNKNAPNIFSNRSMCIKSGELPFCKGDAGGGYFVQNDGLWTLGGIISHSFNDQCDPKDFVAFVDLSKFMDWIYENMKTD